MKKIGFIGAGNMAGAIIRGLAGKDFALAATDIDAEKLANLQKQGGCQPASLTELVQWADLLVLAVKPTVAISVLKEISQGQKPYGFLASITASIPVKVYEKALPDWSIVRVMPNTSATLGLSMTALVRGGKVSEAEASLADEVFKSLGDNIWLAENQMPIFTAISGCGPAYFYLMVQELVQAAQDEGLSEDEARQITIKTLVGAGAMLTQAKQSPAELRRQVTSPGGITEAAINQFLQGDFGGLIQKVITAALARDAQISSAFD